LATNLLVSGIKPSELLLSILGINHRKPTNAENLAAKAAAQGR